MLVIAESVVTLSTEVDQLRNRILELEKTSETSDPNKAK